MDDLASRLRELQASGTLDLPATGRGATARRHRTLMQWGRSDLSLARLAEAHVDAAGILAEQGRAPAISGLYGVWASDGPQSRLTAVPRRGGGWSLDGMKQYCSGATLVSAALVTAHAGEDVLLFELPMSAPGIRVAQSTWASPAFADTATGPVEFNGVSVPDGALIGEAGWYLARPGFWNTAISPAACWAGGALSLVEAASALGRRDPHSRAQLGALKAIAWGLEAVLVQAGDDIDTDPNDGEHARLRALKVRHLVERWCTEVLDRFGRATGPQLLAYDGFVVRQSAALSLYIRQCHAERDLEGI